ncbi:MAG: hypothetical protein COV67_10065 [Nitrospinae bacterium CG11_big_fil_rev_8_21_14_0_20_56_8]|nr:MAG: hypothetical protein COV67_10065 [Nitrospinae bacterium CG11_big_fil_rev_8_21_14_0_20_56_8]
MNAGIQLFSDIYLKFTHWFSQVQVREDEPRIRVPEKTIRCIWNDQLFRTHELETTDGEQLEIVFPGYWTFGPGPDFKSAAIKVNGVLYEGDVEIHVYSSDWRAHNHSQNPEFGNVILHVFLWGERKKSPRRITAPSSPRLPGGHIFELEIKDYLTKGILELSEELDFDSYPVMNQFNFGRCHLPLARLPKEKLEQLLNAAGDARIFTKMERFHDRIIDRGYEQTFYEGVAEALGYPVNKQAFVTLAESLPLPTLRMMLPTKIAKKEKILHLQAMLFGMAGLMGFKHLDLSSLAPEDRTYFSRLARLWEKYRKRLPAPTLTDRDWKFGGIRPANFPYRRIAGLARLLLRHEAQGMFADFLKGFKAGIVMEENKRYATRIPRALYDFFCVEGADDYWGSHYSPGGKKLAAAQNLVGPDRSAAITINIVVPIALIYARACKSVEMEAALNLLYRSCKGKTDNKLLRFMKYYIFGNNAEMIRILSTEKQKQGLMQVYQDFCTQNENNCLRCQFPDVIHRYFT